MLAAAGHRVTIVDDDYGRAADGGLPVTGSAAPPCARAAVAAGPLWAAG